MSMTEQIESALNKIGVIFPDSSNRITDLVRLSGGASQETWAFGIGSDGQESERFVLRRAPDGQAHERSETTIPLSTEAKLIQMAQAHRVPVPSVRHICVPSDGLGDGFIMAFVEGETIARKILRDGEYTHARRGLAEACGRTLGNIHALALADMQDLQLPRSNGVAQLDQYEEIYLGLGRPRPIIELAFKVLRAALPNEMPDVLVHGDFRLGNLMVDATGLAAVLDWELAHIGDPREDIGWICVNSWRFGQSKNRVGGFGHLEDFLAGYADTSGHIIARDEIDWWEMLGSLKWGIMCMIMYESFRTGAVPSVERAAIGRRVSETEIDLLNLIEKTR
ncbi:MAG: phosphotransferase family protein [Hyphomonadaceae bacterium]